MPRSTPDYFALRVLNTILGGAFTSRLNQNLREVHGYAYGAGSAFDMRARAGPFYAAAGVQTDKTAEALKEFFNELDAHPRAGSGRRAREGEELPGAAAAAQLRDDARALAGRRSRSCSSTTCRPTTTRPTPTASAR